MNIAHPKVLATEALLTAAKCPRTAAAVPDSPQGFYDMASRENIEMALLRQKLSARHWSEVMVQMHWYLCWLRDCLPVFQLTESLLAALTLTDAKDVPVDEVRPPFDSFLVTLPPNFWRLSHEGTHSFVIKDDGSMVDPHGTSDIRALQFHRYTARDDDERARPAIAILALAESGISLWDNTHLPEEGNLNDWLSLGQFEQNPNYQYRPGEVNQDERAIQRQARRLWVNLAFYIAENGRGRRLDRTTPKKRSARARRRRRAPQERKPTTWLLGQEVKLGRPLLDAARECHTQRGWQVSVRHVVRGHYKQQAYGPGRTLRKRIWVQPYHRGPEDGPKVSHLYTMEAEDG